ncbi:UNVERIFIED_CONTAM: hypothetical protein Sradi_5912500 [Sesamum radiatum]|uniref:Uncharacterized protein n=1 Tax=Sesamum radiatum TaxID=300843 RepID=A0AAW2KST3_SESRA
MENGPPTIGFEDGTIDVERLLVEPQDGHVSVDSVMCFSDIAENAMEMEEVSRRFGVPNTAVSQECGEDILNGDVLDSMREVEVGYFRMQNDFCSMGEEYLLGVEFAESITNLDYGSSEGLQTSVSDSPVLASAAVTDTPWKADLFRAMEVPECQNHQLNADSSRFGEISDPCHKSETFIEDAQPSKPPTSCALQDIGKFHDISSCSFQDILSDENDTGLSPSVDMLYSPKNEKSSEFGLPGQNGEIKRFQEQDVLVTTSAPASHTNTFPTQKRSRKPTQRYIDELADPVSRHSKKRREVSSSKSLGVKDHKKCRIGPRAIRLPAEESSVKAIQVPFGSLVQNECPESCAYDMVRSSDRGNLMTRSKDSRISSENQKKKDEFAAAIHIKKRDDSVSAATQKKRDDSVAAVHLKKREDNVTAAHIKKREDNVTAVHIKKRDDNITAVSPKKRDDYDATVRQKKRDDYLAAES